jgi:hypothetical protein
MTKGWWLMMIAGLACSTGAGTATDAAGPADAAEELVPDAGLAPADLAADSAPATAQDAASAPDLPQGSADASPLADGLSPDAGAASLAADMNAFFFGPTVPSCESGMAAVVTVSNVGGSPSAILQVRLEGTSADAFRVTKDGCGGHVLAAGGTCVVEVRFAPKQFMAQSLTAALVVEGASSERATAALSGEANVTNFDVFPWMGAVLDFQTVKVGASSAVMTATWTNATDAPATLGSPMLLGVAAGEFSVTTNGCSGQTLAAHETCSIGLRFRPEAGGLRPANLIIQATGACGYSFGDFLSLSGVGE